MMLRYIHPPLPPPNSMDTQNRCSLNVQTGSLMVLGGLIPCRFTARISNWYSVSGTKPFTTTELVSVGSLMDVHSVSNSGLEEGSMEMGSLGVQTIRAGFDWIRNPERIIIQGNAIRKRGPVRTSERVFSQRDNKEISRAEKPSNGLR